MNVTRRGISLLPVALLVLSTAVAAQDTAPKAHAPAPGRFSQARNEELKAKPERAEAEIVFIGDSITQSWDNEPGLSIWAKQLAPLNAFNLGCNAETTENVRWRLEQGAFDGMENLKLIVLLIGTNDIGLARRSGEVAAAGVAALLEDLRKHAPQAKILLMAITPKGRGQDRVDTANQIIKKLADGKTVVWQDISDEINKVGGRADRVGHFNEKGYEVWANEIVPTIKKMMM